MNNRYEHTQKTLLCAPTLREVPKDRISRLDLPSFGGGAAFVLRGFLSSAECQFYIDHAEELGMEDCGYKHSIRRADRTSAASSLVAERLFQRARPFLEANIDLIAAAAGRRVPLGFSRNLLGSTWYPTGLNETFRVCRYDAGGFFLPHHDGGFTRNRYDRSIKTLMIYLNDDFEGGATNFYCEKQRHYEPGDEGKVLHSFQPKAGDALIFNSKITHDGAMLLSGRKYIMRSEVMYSQEGYGGTCSSPPQKPVPPDHDIDWDPDDVDLK
uniref:Prolyl 4-hydroxylase alpha subunit domain-containing protein n=1 Tax=Trieres chinensis TaxID=1514140 RepID=A0A7S2A460_TRICV|mmetsp:Transcript_39171/g.79847  ORF Transcript_39171/g.79847 Transcript_39171/m.79847 type:complete len:269 (+) Transcript_39171:29-835(+)